MALSVSDGAWCHCWLAQQCRRIMHRWAAWVTCAVSNGSILGKPGSEQSSRPVVRQEWPASIASKRWLVAEPWLMEMPQALSRAGAVIHDRLSYRRQHCWASQQWHSTHRRSSAVPQAKPG